MTVPRLFVQSPVHAGARGQLDREQSRQTRSTLRLRVGSDIVVFDGTGVEGQAVLTAMQKEAVGWEVREVSYPEREPRFHLRVALALLRGERFDLAVQKVTELGVARITPLAADRCVVTFPFAADWERRSERLLRVIREAAEQSERVTLPRLDAPLTLAELLAQGPATCLVERSGALPLAGISPQSELTLVIGPEGGWSPGELALIERSGAGQSSLGPLILRAETAAIVAAGTLIQRSWYELKDGTTSWPA